MGHASNQDAADNVVRFPERREKTRIDGILADRRLSLTARLAWLLTAFSAERGHAFIAREKLRARLRTGDDELYEAMGRLREWGYFRRVRVSEGRLRTVTQHHPILAGDEELEDLAARLRRDRRIDLCVRTIWHLVTRLDGGEPITLPDRAVAHAGGDAMRRVRVRMAELGYFVAAPGSGRGRFTTYRWDASEGGGGRRREGQEEQTGKAAETPQEGRTKAAENPSKSGVHREYRERGKKDEFAEANSATGRSPDQDDEDRVGEDSSSPSSSQPHPDDEWDGSYEAPPASDPPPRSDLDDAEAMDRDRLAQSRIRIGHPRRPPHWDWAGMFHEFCRLVIPEPGHVGAYRRAVAETGAGVVRDVLTGVEPDDQMTVGEFMAECYAVYRSRRRGRAA